MWYHHYYLYSSTWLGQWQRSHNQSHLMFSGMLLASMALIYQTSIETSADLGIKKHPVPESMWDSWNKCIWTIPVHVWTGIDKSGTIIINTPLFIHSLACLGSDFTTCRYIIFKTETSLTRKTDTKTGRKKSKCAVWHPEKYD